MDTRVRTLPTHHNRRLQVSQLTSGTHSFKPCSKPAPEQRRALIFSRPNLEDIQWRYRERASACPAPREKPGPHPPPSNDPPFLAAPPWGHRPPAAGWHPYPLLVAQALSIAPESKLRPAVDWLSNEDDRLVRRPAPPRPLGCHLGARTCVGRHPAERLRNRGRRQNDSRRSARGHLPPPRCRPSDTASRCRACGVIALEAHPDARICPRTSQPVFSPTGVSAFHLPRGDLPQRIIPASVHAEWRDRLPVYRTPLRLDAWRDALRWHPDSEFVNDVLSGIEFGRAVGFAGDRFQQRDCTNPKAHEEHQPKLRLIRAAEFEQGWRAGPFTGSEGPPLFNLMAHPTKAIFKRLSDKIRQVVNISYPHDESAVNRNIVRCTRLWNVSFDQAAAIAASLGHGTLMWKFDLVSAYKLVASLVQDWHLQGELEIIDGVKCYSFSTTRCFGAASSADVFHDHGSAGEFIATRTTSSSSRPPRATAPTSPTRTALERASLTCAMPSDYPSPNSKGRHLNSFSSVQVST